MFIAKMHTRYPGYHGSGYYNFLMDIDKGSVECQIEDNNHDFMLDGDIVKTDIETFDELLEKYPTKESLNDRYFK